MKKIISLLLAVVMSLPLVACSKKISDEEVWALYEEIELTAENVMDYFELVEVEDKDDFGDSTGETAFILKIKDGYFFEPSDVTVLRVNYTSVTIKYAEESEKPEFPIENIENNELVVDYNAMEEDRHFNHYDRQQDLMVTNHSQYAEDGYICETQITDWEIAKVVGKVVAYNLSELDKLFPVDKEGFRNVAIWFEKNHSYTEKFDANSEDWEHAYWYEIIYNLLVDVDYK